MLSQPLIIRSIRENLSIVMSFAFSRIPLENLLESHYKGEWKYLTASLLNIPEQRANKACIDLALFLRKLDDEQKISPYLKKTKSLDFGILKKPNEGTDKLTIRDACNKIIHASELRWNFSDPKSPIPILICIPDGREQWVGAEINLLNLAGLCGLIMHLDIH